MAAARPPPPPVTLIGDGPEILSHDIATDYDVQWAAPLDPRGQIFPCTCRQTGEGFVVKLLKQLSPAFAERAFKECKMQHFLTSRAKSAVVNLYRVYENRLFYLNNVEIKALLIVMQYCRDGDLFAYLRAHNWALSEEESRDMFGMVAQCVHRLHALNICHRDIKPENIFLHRQMVSPGVERLVPLLADFGHSKSECAESPLKTAEVGTDRHNAKEIQTGQYMWAVDVYALGTVLFFMLSGEPPFKDSERPPLDFSKPAWHKVSGRAVALIRSMLQDNASQRPTMSAVVHDEWLLLPLPEQQPQAAAAAEDKPFLPEIDMMVSFDAGMRREREIHCLLDDMDIINVDEPAAQRPRIDGSTFPTVQFSKGLE